MRAAYTHVSELDSNAYYLFYGSKAAHRSEEDHKAKGSSEDIIDDAIKAWSTLTFLFQKFVTITKNREAMRRTVVIDGGPFSK